VPMTDWASGREREREGECVCVCVCVWTRESFYFWRCNEFLYWL